MGKCPAFLWYPNDWIGDPQLAMARASTRGIWIDFLCAMWWTPRRGVLEGTEEELCRLGRCEPEELAQFLRDAQALKFADVTFGHNEMTRIVTVMSRRMMRDEKRRINGRIRQNRFRVSRESNAPSNADVTPASSSTSVPSTSVSVPPLSPRRRHKPAAEAPTDPVEAQVIDVLNQVAGTSYRPGLAYGKNLRARIAEGAALEDLLAVVRFKAERWGSNDSMRENLNPTTLFRPENYQRYIEQATGRRILPGAEPGSTLTTPRTSKNLDVIRAWGERHGAK